jgi:hypothetical protein
LTSYLQVPNQSREAGDEGKAGSRRRMRSSQFLESTVQL